MNIVIADPHPGIRSALSFLLSAEMPSAVLFQAGCRLHLLERCSAQQPDCILLDPFEIIKNDREVSVTETDLIHQIQSICPQIHLIGMSSGLDAIDCLDHLGIELWIQKTDAPDLIISVITSCLKPGQMDR